MCSPPGPTTDFATVAHVHIEVQVRLWVDRPVEELQGEGAGDDHVGPRHQGAEGEGIIHEERQTSVDVVCAGREIVGYGAYITAQGCHAGER